MRDDITWLNGQGSHKEHDISKALDKRAGAEREVVGRRQFADGSFVRRTGGDFNGEQSDSIERRVQQ